MAAVKQLLPGRCAGWLAARPGSDGPNRRFLTAVLLVVTIAGASCGAITGWLAREITTQSYTAAAVFSVDHVAPDMPFLSFSKAIEAEQTARVLRAGRTDEIVPTGGSTYHWEWVAGPDAGQVSFQVHSDYRSEANKLVAELFTHAGPAGRALLNPSQPRPTLTPKKVTSAVAQYRLGTATVALSAGVGGSIAVGLFVLGMLAFTARGSS